MSHVFTYMDLYCIIVNCKLLLSFNTTKNYQEYIHRIAHETHVLLGCVLTCTTFSCCVESSKAPTKNSSFGNAKLVTGMFECLPSWRDLFTG